MGNKEQNKSGNSHGYDSCPAYRTHPCDTAGSQVHDQRLIQSQRPVITSNKKTVCLPTEIGHTLSNKDTTMSDLQWNKVFAYEQSGEDQELLEELLGLLTESSISDLQKIRDGLAAGDGQAVADAAHSIKGAAASLGVEGLRAAAYDIERKGRGNQLAAIDIAVISELVGALADLKA
jgi:HPt (histidine-containing phosphotransfer) domain-containing protein